jgi:hypothetical protein
MVLRVWQCLWLIPLGFAVGAYGTFIGAGGGFVLMPVLLLLYPGERSDALAAISLAVVFFNAASGSIAYGRMRRIDYKSGLILAAATIPGAVFGAMTTGYIPRREFDAVMGIVMTAVSAYLLWRPVPETGRPAGAAAGAISQDESIHRLGTYNLPLGVGLSFIVGYLSSVLGIGGGIIHVPALVNLLGFPVHVATATSHFILAFMSLAGTAVHAATGVLEEGLGRAAMLAVGVVAGAQVGAWLSGRARGPWIIRGLAAALAVVGVRVLILSLEAGR